MRVTKVSGGRGVGQMSRASRFLGPCNYKLNARNSYWFFKGMSKKKKVIRIGIEYQRATDNLRGH